MHEHNPAIHRRRSIRLKNYDYSQPGGYFITICTHNHVCLLGEIQDGTMIPSDLGKIVLRTWQELPAHYPNLSLPEIVRALKSFSARLINLSLNSHGILVWQRNYYEHVIRNENELNAIRQYILDNPLQWELDRDNPANIDSTKS